MPVIFDININIKSEDDFLLKIEDAMQSDVSRTFFYLNSYSLYLINHDNKFNSSFINSDYIWSDGISIKIGLFFINKAIVEKVAFSHFFYSKLSEFLKEKKSRIYCIGSSETNITKAVSSLKSKHSLNILGFRSGFFLEKESNEIIHEINDLNPEVLLVGAGMPKSEKWIMGNITKINANCVISVGNFFDIASGSIKLAPRILYNSGFEWIFRMAQEPKRLLPRYIKANSYYVYRLIKDLFH